MLTYKNDPLLFDNASEPKDYITAKDIDNEDLIFLKEGVLNLYSALVKKKDFKRTDKFNILLRRIPYISGEKVTTEFINLLNKHHSSKENYIKFREEIADYCYLKERIPLNQFNGWIKRKEIPFIAIRILSYKLVNETKIMSYFFSLCDKISGLSSPGFSPPVTLEKCLDPKNIYFIGTAFGDGGFERETTWSLADGTLEKDKLFYSEEYIRFIIGILKEVYKIKTFNISKPHGNQKKLTISNKFFCRFINFFFDIPFSYKDERLQVPKIFNHNNKKDEYLFWRGLSDTDGSFRNFAKTFTLGMKQRKLLAEFSKFLNWKDISHSRKGQHLNVFANSLNKYAEIVGSSHPRKQKILLRQLEDGPSHQVFRGINKNNMIRGYFDLSKIPNLRVYLDDLFKKIFRNKNITNIMKKTGASRQTVHNWKNNVTAIPFSLIKKFYKGYTFYLLSKYDYIFTIGKKGSNKVYLPTKLTDKINFFASCVRPTKRGLCLNIRGNPKAKRYKEQIEEFFKIKFNYIPSREYRCESSIINIFFKTFFVYDTPWKSYNKENIKKLQKKWIIKDKEQKAQKKYYYT